MRNVVIKFSVEGFVKQTVELWDDCVLTDKEIQDLLEKGNLSTTIQEDGTLYCLDSETDIGRIVKVDNECTYQDFEVTEKVIVTPVLVHLGDLVRSFDCCENGMPEITYDATCNLVQLLMGQKALTIFVNSIEKKNDLFSLKDRTGHDCWSEMTKTMS